MRKSDLQVWEREFKNFKRIILELCYPTTCILCGKIDRDGLCNKCKKEYQIVQEPRCMCCGKPIVEEEKEYCSDCLLKKKIFSQGRSLWLHQKNIKQSVYRFKYKNHRIYGEKYAKLLVQEYGTFIQTWKPQCIISIPVHERRRRMRGYNQAEVLGKAVQLEINEKLGVKLPLETRELYRKKETIYQKKLDAKQRSKNINGAFGLRENYKLPKSVLVVDDIYTTGATIQEVSKILVKSGVENVYFLTISIGQGF